MSPRVVEATSLAILGLRGADVLDRLLRVCAAAAEAVVVVVAGEGAGPGGAGMVGVEPLGVTTGEVLRWRRRGRLGGGVLAAVAAAAAGGLEERSR